MHVCDSKKQLGLSDATIGLPPRFGTGAAIGTDWRRPENSGCVEQLIESKFPTSVGLFISQPIRLLMTSRSTTAGGMASAHARLANVTCQSVTFHEKLNDTFKHNDFPDGAPRKHRYNHY